MEWSRAELVLWSAGLYAPIARYAARATTCALTLDVNDFSAMDPRFAERMIIATRARVVETLCSFSHPQAHLEFSRTMRDSKMVAHCSDTYGRTLYLPTPTTDLLVDRLFALVGADVLNAPADFAGETLCTDCGRIAIAPTACCFRAELRRTSTVRPAAAAARPALVFVDADGKIAAGF